MTFMGSLAGMAVAFLIIGSLLYVRQQHQMEAQVKGMIKEYMPLDMQNDMVDNSVGMDDYDDDDNVRGEVL